jgi:hypothetical protein
MHFTRLAISNKKTSFLVLCLSLLSTFWTIPNTAGTIYTDQVQAYEIYYELDYISSHEPDPIVIEYIIEYFKSRGILLRFNLDEISYEELNIIGLSRSMISNGINFDEFELISEYFFSMNRKGPQYKWILYGGFVEEGDVLGVSYARTIIGRTIECRHILIALKKCEQIAEELDLNPYQVEAVTLMHEIGHSIGIIKESTIGTEIYDSDSYSVMALLRRKNCEQYLDGQPNWHYSEQYWKYRYMSFYQRHLLNSKARYLDKRVLKMITSR